MSKKKVSVAFNTVKGSKTKICVKVNGVDGSVCKTVNISPEIARSRVNELKSYLSKYEYNGDRETLRKALFEAIEEVYSDILDGELKSSKKSTKKKKDSTAENTKVVKDGEIYVIDVRKYLDRTFLVNMLVEKMLEEIDEYEKYIGAFLEAVGNAISELEVVNELESGTIIGEGYSKKYDKFCYVVFVWNSPDKFVFELE